MPAYGLGLNAKTYFPFSHLVSLPSFGVGCNSREFRLHTTVSKKLGWLELNLAEHNKRMLAFQCRIDASVPKNVVLFVGDSLIQGMCLIRLSLEMNHEEVAA